MSECNEEINQRNIKLFESKEYNKIDERLRTIAISFLYDMGWQKRATGRIYNYLSGHVFLIGCLGKNMAKFGVTNKKCIIFHNANN